MGTAITGTRREGWILGLTLLTFGACVQQQPSGSAASSGSETQVQVGQIVPGPDSLTQGTSTGGIVAGTGNAVSGAPPGVPSLQNISLTLSLSAASAPDLCLSAPDATLPQTSLMLRSCAADPLQKWVLVNGLLQSNKGGCLTINTAQNNTISLSACDVNNINQQVTWTGGQLSSFATGPTSQLVLQVPASPATTTSVLSFAPFDVSRISQQRWTLAEQEHDASQKLVQHGVAMAVLEKSGTCLSAIGGPSYAPCAANDLNQMWMLTSTGFIQNEGTQKCLGSGATTPAMVDCNPGPTVAWLVKGGVLFDTNNTCLDADGSTATLKACDLTNSRHFLIGLSRGL